MRQKGFTVDDSKMIINGDYTHKSGYLAMKDLMRKIPNIDGVFVANDQMAVGAMKAISETEKNIPGDIKVIGYDDVFIASVLEPSLSTIHIKKYYMGTMAAELLLEQIEKNNENVQRKARAIEIEPMLVIRKSTVKKAPNDWILVDW
jgi:DNA-binding LacI/PurR family transcriptional regulator